MYNYIIRYIESVWLSDDLNQSFITISCSINALGMSLQIGYHHKELLKITVILEIFLWRYYNSFIHSLVIALIGGSKVVILDEATSGMDPYSRRLAINAIIRRKSSGKRTFLLSTHYMYEFKLFIIVFFFT